MVDSSIDTDSREESEAPALDAVVERRFTCTACGYTTADETGRLQYRTQGVCPHCGGWTVRLADEEDVIEAAREVADALSGPTLTERQALVYLLREVLALDRETAARITESTPSNVDNLHRRSAEKIADARRVIAGIESIQPEDGVTTEDR